MVFVKLVPKDERDRSVKQFMHDARLRLQKIPGVMLNFLEDPDSFQKPLVVAVQGDDIATLKKYAAQLKQEMYKIPGIVDIEATMEQDLPEYRLIVDRERAAASGLGSGAVANTVAHAGRRAGGLDVRGRGGRGASTCGCGCRSRCARDVTQVNDLKVTVPGLPGRRRWCRWPTW